jgi:hypothetical protein
MSDVVVTTETRLIVCPHDGLRKGLRRIGKNRYTIVQLPGSPSMSQDRYDEYVRLAHAINGAPIDLRETCCATNVRKTIVAIWIPSVLVHPAQLRLQEGDEAMKPWTKAKLDRERAAKQAPAIRNELVEAREVPGKGRGVFAKQAFRKGDVTCALTGKVYPTTRVAFEAAGQAAMDYVIYNRDGQVIVPDLATVGGHLANHQLQPQHHVLPGRSQRHRHFGGPTGHLRGGRDHCLIRLERLQRR